MTSPTTFDRRHAVSETEEIAWRGQTAPELAEPPPTRLEWTLNRVGLGLDKKAVYVPATRVKYAAILDHGFRSETRGVVLHVNAGYAKGTEGFFTNGLREPFGSEGVGAHFEISGRGLNGLPSLSNLADFGSAQYVPIDRVTWHAVEANGFAIGVEHAGFGKSTSEWEKLHFNEIGNSAYRVAWILHRYELGPPEISLTNSSRGNIWPHSCGGASWGGHQCPGPAFPYELWLKYCKKAYKNKWHWK